MNLEGHIFTKVYVLYFSLFILKQNLQWWFIVLAGRTTEKAVPYRVY